MNNLKIGASFILGIVLFLSATAYFTATTMYGNEYQQLLQIKSLIWIAIVVYIAGQLK